MHEENQMDQKRRTRVGDVFEKLTLDDLSRTYRHSKCSETVGNSSFS